jgi:hypothetical protein
VSNDLNQLYSLLLYVALVEVSAFTIIFLALAISHVPYPGAKTDYCYDQDLEGQICFETLKMCEKMQIDDEMADGSCHKDTG